uniref:Uncharacterized protein n=1 Tax=Oryza meridionalis TaxID=40149 RepID=A0A0E0CF14_9ORYZ
MAVSLLKSKAIPTSVIAFAGDVPLLAGGVVQDNGISPRTPMSIFRTSPGEKMLEMVASFPSPEGFCSIDWAKPSASNDFSCQAGLIAGGLENGMVAVWNPDLKLRKLPSYLPDEEILKPHPDGVQTWIRKDFEVIEDYLDQVQVDGKSRALHLQVSPTYQEMSGNLMVEYQEDIMCRTSSSGVVALFAKHTGKVRGLSFNPNAPNLLASGAADGRIMLYDLAHPLAETIPVQLCDSRDEEISCLCWNSSEVNVIASTTTCGRICFHDTRAKTIIGCTTLDCKTKSGSTVIFCPDPDSEKLLVAREDSPSVKILNMGNTDHNPAGEIPFSNSEVVWS